MPEMRTTMNFSFMMDYEFTDEKMKEAYQQIADLLGREFLLEAAEGVWHDTPRCCGADLLFL